MIADGCIHGCFQPFHNEHLACALTALHRCSFLWIGLEDPFPRAKGVEQPDQQLTRLAAPLTYHERQFMITRVLVAEGVAPERFSFTPFPINTPELLPHYLDPQVTCFVANNDELNRRRAANLEAQGYPVETLSHRRAGISSQTILNLLLNGDDTWHTLVPSSVAYYLDEIDLAARLV